MSIKKQNFHWADFIPATDRRRGGAQALQGIRVAIIGGGPGGLALANIACDYGAKVSLFEKTGDPLRGETGYLLRSFNFTLNDVGRAELGDWRAWANGITLHGRAVHQHDGPPKIGSYTGDRDGLLTCIPRNSFRRNLARLGRGKDIQAHYNTTVTRLEPALARFWTDKTGGTPQTADLIVVADGLHSVIDACVPGLQNGSINKVADPLRYMAATLPARDVRYLLSPHIHFWYENHTDAYTVGFPNRGGSLSLLLISRFSDIARDDHPFASPHKATQRLQLDFPRIYKLAPWLAEELPKRPVGEFHYKETSHFVLGPNVVVIGDAAGTRPPWAGFGTNVALHAAGSLMRCIAAHNSNLAAALPKFQLYQQGLARLVHDYIKGFGKFIGQQVSKKPGAHSRDALAQLTRQARESDLLC